MLSRSPRPAWLGHHRSGFSLSLMQHHLFCPPQIKCICTTLCHSVLLLGAGCTGRHTWNFSLQTSVTVFQSNGNSWFQTSENNLQFCHLCETLPAPPVCLTPRLHSHHISYLERNASANISNLLRNKVSATVVFDFFFLSFWLDSSFFEGNISRFFCLRLNCNCQRHAVIRCVIGRNSKVNTKTVQPADSFLCLLIKSG